MYPSFSEFGLYRYENASARLRNGKRNGCFSSAIVYSIVAMTAIFTIILYIFISNRSIEITNNTAKRHRNATNVGLEVIEIAARNSSESVPLPKRIKRLDSEDDSNLSPTFLPSRALKQPRQKIVQRLSLPSNHKLSPRSHQQHRQRQAMPKPNEFLKPPSGKPSYYNKANNIQDILRSNHRNSYQPITAAPHFAHPNHNNQAQMSQFAQFSHNQMQSVPVQLTGKYRHPRTNVELSQIFQQSQGLQAEGSDPFRNFRPVSAFEINHMMNQNIEDQQHQNRFLNVLTTDTPYFRRKFRQKLMRQQQQAQASSNSHVEDRNEAAHGGKPFSLMLDVFPLPGEEHEYQQHQQQQQLLQMQKMARLRPLMTRYYQDPNFFNTMNFPQLTPRYPPHHRYQQMMPQASTHYGSGSSAMQKPSQLIVHLNLFPKSNGAASFKRSSEDEEETRVRQQQQQQEEVRHSKAAMRKNQTLDISSTPFNINFNVLAGNGNAHPENVMYHKIREFNRTSTEATHSQEYFYDEEDEFEDQSSSLAPSLVYKNIFRDRPVHMMLRNRNRTATTRPPTIKTNQKFEYQAIKRPRTKYLNYIPKVSAPFF